MTIALKYAVRSDKGLVRGNNEDSVYAGPRLLAIADGMGGHAGGEVASKIVIGAMEFLDEDRHLDDVMTSLREAVEDANESLSLQVERDSKLEGMGTTLTALRFSGTKVGLVHVGDSRAYLLRNGQLAQITHDDTYVQSLVDSGRLTAEEAMHHPRKSVILRALNGVAVEPDLSIREARPGDRYLLCTDGLTDVLRSETLMEALSEGTPQEAADRLVALALRGGGPDNVTVIVADLVDGDGDDVPVVAGAVVDPGEDTADDESPAARAAGLGLRHPIRRAGRVNERRWPRVIVPLLIAAVLLAAAVGTWNWTQRQYYVGKSGDLVAVFKGVNTAFGPLKFYSVVEQSELHLIDLEPAARSQVEAGITARNRTDADGIVERLRDGNLLPLCSTVTAASSAPSATNPARPSSPARPTTRRLSSPARPTSARPSSPARPTITGSATGTGSASAPTAPVPGVDCREPR